MSEFEREVRKALIDKNLKIRDLAIRLGISQAYIYDIFKGNRPGSRQKEKIIQLLDLKGAQSDENAFEDRN
jgi:transcriptional regulator with XRE-family HTH domain